MQIVYTSQYKEEIKNLTAFIASYSLQNAINFEKSLREHIEKIPPFVYSFRQNSQIDDENVRDLIFKGYVVPFLVFDEKIYILGIYKQNIWKPNFGEILDIKKDKF